jgi:2-methylcitrate dehydratase PrpD
MAAPDPSPAASCLADFVVGLQYDDLPVSVVDAIKLHLLDSIGCALAAHGLSAASGAESVIRDQGGREVSTAIGTAQPLPASSAAFINGTLMHALDFDGTHGSSRVHVSAPVVPAALACAEEQDLDGRDLVLAIAAGYETALCIGALVGLRLLERGFHPTPWCGVFGATASSGKARAIDEATLVSAFGIAGSFGSGLMEPVVSGSTTKPLHAGWAAQGGTYASALAAAGVTGSESVLEGTFGFYSAIAGGVPVGLEDQLSQLGREWQTERIAFKPYPACHIFHSHLDALRDLLLNEGLVRSQVAEIVAYIPEPLVPFVLEPVADKRRPKTGYDAKFSLQYSLAAMLTRGEVDLSTYSEESLTDPVVLDAAARVGYEAYSFESFPEFFPGGVKVVTNDGAQIDHTVSYERGSAAHPMSPSEVRAKFDANARLALSASDAADVADKVAEVETLTSSGLGDLMSALGGVVVRG